MTEETFELSDFQKELHTAIRAFTTAVERLNDLSTGVELSTFEPVLPSMGDWQLTNKVMAAQMLMAMLGNPDEFNEGEREFWLSVSFELGPDWIAKMRRVAGFMKMCENA